MKNKIKLYYSSGRQNINGIDNLILQFAEIIEFNECFETKLNSLLPYRI